MYSSLLKVTSFYKDFLSDYYHSNPGITEKSYQEQFKHLMAEALIEVGEVYLETDQKVRAKEDVEKGLKISEEIGFAEYTEKGKSVKEKLK